MAEPAGRVAPRGVLPRAALKFLRRKRLVGSQRWTDVWREEHAAAFTVAQMTDEALLRQTHQALVRALRQGETFETFRSSLDPWLRAHGWAPVGRGGSIPKRLRRIFDTNLRTARAAGRWDRIGRTAELLPYLLYTPTASREPRPDHQAWANTCLPADHPWWRTHLPPNGWGCKCGVRQVAAPPEGAPTTAPADGTYAYTPPGGGWTVQVPQGIDPGWDFNAGMARVAGVNGALTRTVEKVLSGEKYLAGASAAARDQRARRIVARHVGGPAFRWFATRPRGVGALEWQAAPDRIEVTPVGVMPPALARQVAAPSRVLVLNERVMHKQLRNHPELSADVYARVQDVLDHARPRLTDTPGRWLFDLALPDRILRLVVDVADDRPPEVVSVFYRKKRKGRTD